MAITPKDMKQALELLLERKALPFGEMLAVFANKKGKVNKEEAKVGLNTLWNEYLFELVDGQGEQAFWNDDAPFQAPDDYTLRFLSLEGKETLIASKTADRIDPQDVQELVPGYVWVGLKRRTELRIVGAQEGATVLAERLRAFTHQFAFSLVTGQHERIAQMFAAQVADGQGLDSLLERIGKLEREYGGFDYFDHVEVIQVLNGDTSMVKDGDGNIRMDIPKAFARSVIRGWSEFQLISVRTPNGVAVHEVLVALKIVEEDGCLRIAKASVE